MAQSLSSAQLAVAKASTTTPRRHAVVRLHSTRPEFPALDGADNIDVLTSLDNDNSPVEEYVRLFQLADADENGNLDKAEIKKILQSFDKGRAMPIQNWMTDEEMDSIFDQYDIDGNGTISAEEFKSMMADEVLLEGNKRYTWGDELAELFDKLGSPMSYMQLFRVMEKYDKDGNGQIDFNEFLRMFRDQLIELTQLMDYVKLNPKNINPFSDGRKRLVVTESGDVSLIFSGEELDDVHEQNPDRLICLMASLTWCRPCKAFQKKYLNFAEHYPEVRFVKFYGNSNERTKTLFKDELKVKGTPWFYFYRNGEICGNTSGANASKLEEAVRGMLRPDERPADKLEAN
eukprot:CAMPEP_0177790450 /NCGR_PEP_ID=MMETSP0491_2-20121128/23361_1 /TAXON_ID=63592 /ORGANISM="Tetraselmis chuii, Strain PLY429" /LENGTH=345 /DNA_ID=CAMNT_0019312525 /DNA_START=198 /DNA_END=1237 /DNA_ORIENTATION=-